MMCVPLCSNVGLGSSVLRAHTKPLRMPFSSAIRRAKLILVHRGRPPKYHRQSVFLKRMQCRFLQPLARPLYVLRVVLEQDPVNAEVLLHPVATRACNCGSQQPWFAFSTNLGTPDDQIRSGFL